jgi:hypothetical protein
MTSLNLTARVLAKFPARVLAGVGMLITKVNGVWTIAFNSSGLTSQPVTDPANTDIIVEMPDGSLAKVPLSAALAAASGYVEETGKKNGFINGGMQVWQRTVNDTGVTTTRKYVADRWAIKTGAGMLANVQIGGGYHLRAYTHMLLKGAVGVTTVDLDQRIEQRSAWALAYGGGQPNGAVTFSAMIFNFTGAAFTPTLFVSTPTALDNWAASNVRNGGGSGDALQSCPNGVGTRVFWSAVIQGYTDIGNGLEFRLRFPSGSLDAGTKSIIISEIQVEPRPTADNLYSLFEVETFSDELWRCQRYFYKSFPYATAPVTNAGVATGPQAWAQIVGAAAAQPGGLNLRYPADMRTAPTVTTYNPAAANAQPRNETVGADCSAVATANNTDSGVVITCTTAAGSAAGNRMSVHVTAEAEL